MDHGTQLAFKAYATTGSMPAASNQLTVTSNPGFAVNDHIIVELGGEAGLGVRGTVGVGGTWPALSYATTITMNADSGQANLTYAWVVASGAVYQYLSGTWTAVDSVNYYIKQAIPKALVATITGIAGSAWTLSASSTAATTAAAVHYDNAPTLNALGLMASAVEPSHGVWIVPAGRFAVGSLLTIEGHDDWTFRGRGNTRSTLFSPRGVPSAQWYVYQCDRMTIQDLRFEGNARNNGFGLVAEVTQTNVPGGDAYPRGISFYSCTDCVAKDLACADVFHQAVGTSYSTNVWAYRCTCTMTDALQQYIQWLFQWADSTGGGAVDCTVTSPYLTAGFEAFRSTGVSFIRPVGVNATFSMNSSGNFLIEDYLLTIAANSQLSEASFSRANPVINVNSNIQPPDASTILGGVITNPRWTFAGAINGDGDVLKGITINADNPHVQVIGGSITHPTCNHVWAPGVNATGATALVDGLTVVGTNSNTDFGNIYVNGTGGIVRNSTAHRIVLDGGAVGSNNTAN